MTKPTDAEIAAVNPKPRVTPADLDAQVKSCDFKQFGLLTVCVITMQNGFMVTGESACAYPENYNEEIGNRIAFENAKEKMWPLLGYELKSKVFSEQNPIPEHSNPKLRVQAEAEELQVKIDKLQLFIEGQLFPSFSEVQKRLMHNQIGVMHSYHQILLDRLDHW